MYTSKSVAQAVLDMQRSVSSLVKKDQYSTSLFTVCDKAVQDEDIESLRQLYLKQVSQAVIDLVQDESLRDVISVRVFVDEFPDQKKYRVSVGLYPVKATFGKLFLRRRQKQRKRFEYEVSESSSVTLADMVQDFAQYYQEYLTFIAAKRNISALNGFMHEYVDSLVPYQVRFEVHDDASVVKKKLLAGIKSVPGSTDNFVNFYVDVPSALSLEDRLGLAPDQVMRDGLSSLQDKGSKSVRAMVEAFKVAFNPVITLATKPSLVLKVCPHLRLLSVQTMIGKSAFTKVGFLRDSVDKFLSAQVRAYVTKEGTWELGIASDASEGLNVVALIEVSAKKKLYRVLVSPVMLSGVSAAPVEDLKDFLSTEFGLSEVGS
jgi:hypothetical protein